MWVLRKEVGISGVENVTSGCSGGGRVGDLGIVFAGDVELERGWRGGRELAEISSSCGFKVDID